MIELGVKQMRIEQALALFKEGKISIWRASRIAGLPLREMTNQASARVFKPLYDEDVVAEELGVSGVASNAGPLTCTW